MSEKGEDGKFQARNRKKISEEKLRKMNPVQRSRYTAYEGPSKDVAEKQAETQKRLRDQRKADEILNAPPTQEEQIEKDQHAKLIGQLKAAEARNRIRIMRLRYQATKAQEISHLISCQPSALKAVRLQALLPIKHDQNGKGDVLDKLSKKKHDLTVQREHVEELLNDDTNLMTQRLT